MLGRIELIKVSEIIDETTNAAGNPRFGSRPKAETDKLLENLEYRKKSCS
jgi:hypothetical protein